MKMNKKGFTLVELLAVIVILAVVMLIAVTAVGPLMNRARKGAFKTEIASAAAAAQEAFAAEQMTNSAISSNEDYCVTIADLNQKNYYSKGGSADGYTGSVLIETNGTIKVWLMSNNYKAEGQTKENPTIEDVTDGDTISTTCGGDGESLPLS